MHPNKILLKDILGLEVSKSDLSNKELVGFNMLIDVGVSCYLKKFLNENIVAQIFLGIKKIHY